MASAEPSINRGVTITGDLNDIGYRERVGKTYKLVVQPSGEAVGQGFREAVAHGLDGRLGVILSRRELCKWRQVFLGMCFAVVNEVCEVCAFDCVFSRFLIADRAFYVTVLQKPCAFAFADVKHLPYLVA